MVSDNSNRIELKTLLVAVLCLTGAGVGSYLLYEDFNRAGDAGRGKPLARIERREAKVRRKSASSFAWTNAPVEQALFRKDSVQTSDSSAAAIRFDDGTLLELGENSLVVIDSLENLSLDFLKGSVVLRTAEGDKKVTFDANGKARLEDLPVRLVKPEALARFYARESESRDVTFAWAVTPGREASLPPDYALEVSHDRSFVGQKTQVAAGKGGKALDVAVPLRPGSYFWRLAAGGKALTEPSQFKIVEAAALRPSWPVSGERIVQYGDDSAVQFRWSGADELSATGPTEHALEVARDPEFRNIVVSHPVNAASGIASLRDLPAGDLHWRIRSRYAEISVRSEAEKFSITQTEKPQLAIEYPEDKASIGLAPQLHLSWSSNARALEYQVELQASSGKGIPAARSTGLSFAWSKPASGVYRWRVLAYAKGLEVAQTPWSTFSVYEGSRITLRAPVAGQDIRHWDKPAVFALGWDADTLLAKHEDYGYQVEVSPDPAFKGAVLGPRTREASLSSAKLPLKEGKYHWRVSVVDLTGQVIKTSEPSSFVYGVFPTLKAPVAAAPAPNETFNLLKQPAPPVLAWAEVKDAQGYEVTVYGLAPPKARGPASAPPPIGADGAPPAGSRILYKGVVQKTSTELKGLKPAAYYWTVRAIDPLRRPGDPAPLRPFAVTLGEALRKPEIISPEVQ